MTPALTPALALGYLRELSADVRDGVVLGAGGEVLAGEPAMAGPARELLAAMGAAGEAEHTMRHEMIHLWQHVEGLPVDHGPAFRKMARRLDVHPRATRSVEWMDKDRRG